MHAGCGSAPAQVSIYGYMRKSCNLLYSFFIRSHLAGTVNLSRRARAPPAKGERAERPVSLSLSLTD